MPPPPAASPAPGFISEDAAVDLAFQIARQRGLQVDRVRRVHLDGAGRWHVDVRGRGDRALLLLDARDGRLLRGKFRTEAAAAGQPESGRDSDRDGDFDRNDDQGRD
jgi:hypothetical protein